MKDSAMLIDYKYCTGCHACEISCQNEHDFAEGEYGIRLTEMGPQKMEGKWVWNYIPEPSPLCDLCEERRAKGELAACQLHCLGQCIEVIPVSDVSAKLKEHGDSTVVFIP